MRDDASLLIHLAATVFQLDMKVSLWSVDLFRCESAALRTYWVLVVIDQFARRIIGFGVHRGLVDGLWRYVGCSIKQFEAKRHRNMLVRITIRCIASTNGKRISTCWR